MTREEIALSLALEILKLEKPHPAESCVYQGTVGSGYHVCPEKVVATYNLLYAGLAVPTNGNGK